MTGARDTAPATAVVAAAAPLWACAEDVRSAAAPGGCSHGAYLAWVRRLLPDQAPLRGRLHTVALSGEPVRVLRAVDASAVEVELPAQPNGSAGYVGFMDAAHLGADARRKPTHVVAERGVLAMTTGPAAEAEPVELPAGTTVELRSDPAARGDAELLLASGATVRRSLSGLRLVGERVDALELLAIAARFVGAPYLWGGIEAAGVDCSGLVHLAARIGGRVVPRDAHHQWAAMRIDAAADPVAGDLIFFGEEASLEGIDHVGISWGDGRMLHAPEAGRPVVLERLSDRACARTVGVGRYAA